MLVRSQDFLILRKKLKMSSSIETVGFIGCGAMAEVVAEHLLPPQVEIMGFDPQKLARVRGTEAEATAKIPLKALGEVANADLVVFAVPAREIESAVVALHVGSDRFNDLSNPQLIMDISSVKQFPEGWFRRLVSDWGETLVTHPLFGPQSIDTGITGKDIIVTSHEGDKAEALMDHWKAIGANITHMTAEEHDRQMVGVQALPFMVAHAFNSMGLTTQEIKDLDLNNIPLLAMADVAKNHSWPLTETILGFNSYAQTAFEQLKVELHTLLRNHNVIGADLQHVIGKALGNIPVQGTEFSTPTSLELIKLVERAKTLPDLPNSRIGSHNPIVSRFCHSLFNLARQFKSAKEMVELERKIKDEN